jgi:ubiquinone biosynthesis protein COQ9
MNSKQQKLLDSVLFAVRAHGWTEAALAEGAKRAKLQPAEARRIFPDVAAAVDAFHQSINDQMMMAIKANRKFVAMRVRDKIIFAVRARLEAIEDRQDAMRRLLAWSMLPQNLRSAVAALWDAADQIWTAAGDTSTDYNRYTKRLLLIGVMKATLAFWLNDTSKSHAETWAFLDRRIADVMMIGKGAGRVLQFYGVGGSAGAARAIGIADIVSFVRARFAA